MSYVFNGTTKTISLTIGTIQMSVVDLWSRWQDWLMIGDNSKYPIAMKQVGSDPIDPTSGTAIPTYIFLVNGWRIKPQESTHTLSVGGGIMLVDGGGDPFINTIGAFNVRINYQQPVQAITVSTGGGAGGSTASDIWNYTNRTLTSDLGIPAMSTKIDQIQGVNFDENKDSLDQIIKKLIQIRNENLI